MFQKRRRSTKVAKLSVDQKERIVEGYARSMRTKPTAYEAIMREALKASSVHRWKSQYRVEAKYILDFFCLSGRVAIEVDGAQHRTRAGLADDRRRDRYVREHHAIITFRITNDHVRLARKRNAFIRRVDRECDMRRFCLSRGL